MLFRSVSQSRYSIKQDGHQKQDRENAAVKRWLNKNHKNKYGYPVTLLGDDLYSHEPICELAVKQGYKYLSKINYTSKPLLRQTSGVRKQ